MKITLLTALSLFFSITSAYGERSYLVIPDSIEQAEQMSRAAARMEQDISQPPRTAGEAMGRLRHIDHDLDEIIHLGKRFQSTTARIENSIYHLRRFAEHHRRFIRDWEPALQGNYRLINTVYEDTGRNDIRMLATKKVLENLVHSVDRRTESIQLVESIGLKYSKEAQSIAVARHLLHGQLKRIQHELKTIRKTAGRRM